MPAAHRPEILETVAKSILTSQREGFLAAPPYPFTHSLSVYTGCGFGLTTCGLYCYAQYLPNWRHAAGGSRWGESIRVKVNAPDLLDETLRKMRPSARSGVRVLMSGTTDPYQPIEARYELTRRCLEVFARYDDLDLLLIQTRAPLVERDFDLIRQIPYAWLSMTVETDDQELLRGLRGGPPLARRLAVIAAASGLGIRTQIAVSPCLPHTPDFARRLAAARPRRVVVDTFVAGDGSRGARTARSPIAGRVPSWRDESSARRLYDALRDLGVEVGWSASGFSGIPPRTEQVSFFEPGTNPLDQHDRP